MVGRWNFDHDALGCRTARYCQVHGWNEVHDTEQCPVRGSGTPNWGDQGIDLSGEADLPELPASAAGEMEEVD